MDLTSPATIKELLAQDGQKPNKILGQNFLIDKNALHKVVEAAQITKQDTVIEIGPGLGVLTRELAQKANRVVSIEKDRNMVEILKKTVQEFSNVEVILGNALTAENYTLPKDYKVVANIPYYITSPVIRKFLEAKQQPDLMVLMVQKEVAQRICALPPDMSLLAVSVQFYAKPKIVSYVSKGCFWPVPKVDSAIIAITPTPGKNIDPDVFFLVVKAGFSSPRKQLVGNFLTAFKKQLDTENGREKITAWLEKNRIDPRQRAETLSVDDWIGLAKSYQQI